MKRVLPGSDQNTSSSDLCPRRGVVARSWCRSSVGIPRCPEDNYHGLTFVSAITCKKIHVRTAKRALGACCSIAACSCMCTYHAEWIKLPR